MTLNKLASVVAKREGMKKQVAIGSVREILRILVDLEVEFHLLDESPAYVIETEALKKMAKKTKKVKK